MQQQFSVGLLWTERIEEMATGFSPSSAPEDQTGPVVRLTASRSSMDSRRVQSMSVEADMSIGESSPNHKLYTSKRITEAAFSAFEELRRQNQLCDVVIRVDGHDFPAHRVVLAATCPYFRGMFTG